MLNPSTLRVGERPWSSEPSRLLDETVWQAWLLKNREEERRVTAARMKIVMIVAAVLLLLAVIWRLSAFSGLTDFSLVFVLLTAMVLGRKYSRVGH